MLQARVVVMDKEEYEMEVKDMLVDERTYEKLSKDSTPMYTDKLVKIMDRLLEEKITSGQHYKSQDENVPHMYCTPKIHKQGNPLHPIVDYTGSIAYMISHSLADLFSPLVGKTKYLIKKSNTCLKN